MIAGIGTLKPFQPRKIPASVDGGPAWKIEFPEACPWILGRAIQNVRNSPSPKWLQDRLVSVGLRPINALVDVTNFFTIDLGRRQVTKGEVALKLSPKEYDLLAELAVNVGRTVGHRHLLSAIWGSENAEIQYLRVYVGQLRQKLGSHGGAILLTSEPGVGYRQAALPA